MITTLVCCKYSKKTRDEVLITSNKFSGTCIAVEKKVKTFNVVKVFVVIPRDGYVSLQTRKLSECAALRSSSVFKKVRLSSKNGMEWINLF
jgi:hypothetical protein